MNKMKRNWSSPRTEIQRFAPQEYCAVCTWSQHDSADGDYVRGWMIRCCGHDENSLNPRGISCAAEQSFQGEGSHAGHTMTGIFVRALDQTGADESETWFQILAAANNNYYDADRSNSFTVGDYVIYNGHYLYVNPDSDTPSIWANPKTHYYDVNLS